MPHYHYLYMIVGRKTLCKIGAQERWLIREQELQREREIPRKTSSTETASDGRFSALSKNPDCW